MYDSPRTTFGRESVTVDPYGDWVQEDDDLAIYLTKHMVASFRFTIVCNLDPSVHNLHAFKQYGSTLVTA